MSTVLTRRRNRRGTTRDRDRDAGRQPSLFGQVVAPPPLEPRPRPPRDAGADEGSATLAPPSPDDAAAAPAPQRLDEAMSVLWASLTASAPAACPVCDAVMQPRHSAGAGVVGGRCGKCGTTVE